MNLIHFLLCSSSVNPCELHCRPVSDYFSEKMLDAVTDGTPCFMNNKSRNICVNGVCKVVCLGKRPVGTGRVILERDNDTLQREKTLCGNFHCAVICVFVCRRLAVTLVLTQTQWRIAVGSVWATAQAVRRFIRHMMNKKVLVSETPIAVLCKIIHAPWTFLYFVRLQDSFIRI